MPGCDAPNTQRRSLSSANPPLKLVTSNRHKFGAACMCMLKRHTLQLKEGSGRTNLENIELTLELAQWICLLLNNDSGTTTSKRKPKQTCCHSKTILAFVKKNRLINQIVSLQKIFRNVILTLYYYYCWAVGQPD